MIVLKLTEDDASLLEYYLLKSYMRVCGDNWDWEVCCPVGEEALAGCELSRNAMEIRNDCIKNIRNQIHQLYKKV